jgi:hypothetical protein
MYEVPGLLASNLDWLLLLSSVPPDILAKALKPARFFYIPIDNAYSSMALHKKHYFQIAIK